MIRTEKSDWSKWHRAYDDPSSSRSQRLRVVQEQLRQAIEATPGKLQIVSMCAGEGRDVIGTLADHPRRNDITARLVELDQRNVNVARTAIRAARLKRVEVVCTDAGVTDAYEGAVPADIILACGVFGNIADEDIRRTIELLPCLSERDAIVIWTRAREPHRDSALTIRSWFTQRGFKEVAFEAPPGRRFRVGSHRLDREPLPFEQGVHLFRFLR